MPKNLIFFDFSKNFVIFLKILHPFCYRNASLTIESLANQQMNWNKTDVRSIYRTKE